MNLIGNFDKLNQGKMAESDPSKAKNNENYNSAGNVRNLCFVQLDGTEIFLNYSYLISGEYLPEENMIKLTYTTHVIKLKGCNLDKLFESLMWHLPKKIMAVEKRYHLDGNEQIIIHELTINS